MQKLSWAPQQEDSSFLDLRDYLSVLKRRRKLIALVAVVAVGLAIAYTSTQTKIYTATAEVLVKPPISTAGVGGAPQPINVENERSIMLSVPVATIALDSIVIATPARQLLDAVEVTSPKDADVLQIRFSDPSPQIAAQGAQAFAQSYLDYKTQRAEESLSQQAEAILAEISVAEQRPGRATSLPLLRDRLAQINSTTIDAGSILVPAEPPSRPTSPNLPMNVALALFAGLFVGVIVAYARERMDDRLRGRSDLEDTMGVPVMTMIPSVPGWRDRGHAHLVTLEAPRSAAAEAYRTLRTSVLVAAAERGIKTVMVVSAMAGEGKSTTAANLALVLAQADKRVVLISADLRRPRIHEFFGLASDKGLSEVLAGDQRAWESLRSARIDNLWVMSSGKISEQPTELLQSPQMRELIAQQRDVVDFIVIDCPPVLAVADALVLAPLVDCVLYVADGATTPRGAVIQARAQLDQVGARILGAVLNNVGSGTGYAFYGQQYGYTTGTNGATNGFAAGTASRNGHKPSSRAGSSGRVAHAIDHLRKDRSAG